MEPIIRIEQLSFSYPDGTPALDRIDLGIFPGEKVALVGANGAGKTTLLLHLNGIHDSGGQVTIDRLPVNKQNLGQIRALVGLVFQNPDDQLFSPTVYEDVAFGPIYQGLDEALIVERAEQALRLVGMLEMRDRNPYHLSGGEKKRIAIATVLSMQPKILALDEPTAGLDPRARRELMSLLRELPQTMLVATHDLNMAEKLTTRMLIMDGGRIAADGPTIELLRDEALLYQYGLS